MAREVEASVERAVAEVAAELAAGLALDGAGPSEARDGAAPSEARLADLGFDSLAVAELVLALGERFGVPLADLGVTEAVTVGELAALVRGQLEEPAGRLPGGGAALDRRGRVPRGLGRVQQGAKRALGWLVTWQSRLEVRGAEHVPASGPAIVAANHRSMLDIPILVVASPRPIVFMAKRELFADPFRRLVFHALGGFPVRREVADVRAVEVGLGVLERGEVLGLYPEGTRSRSGRMLPFLQGAAWFALRTGAPIVPCGISGTARRPDGRRTLRKHVTVAFGPPIRVERTSDPRARRQQAEALTRELLEAVSGLLV
ncbi:MAG TPA: 1-acyl-sn-glycerol-3-phosphate acyltransferase [Actinomycetota bacterium]|nr:1-acyl-sn-glycerol-3-phosphate acyltransferase [Actinomycetota bacterium]